MDNQAIRDYIESSDDPLAAISEIRSLLHDLSPVKSMPVDLVQWVSLDCVEPNNYNPNSVAKIEMGLLVRSILADGYTQPVVTIYDDKKKKYIIVDGFHRYFSMKSNSDVFDLTGGLLPIVVINKGIADRMASTVRHNRARGAHSVEGMANLVFQMLENGKTDPDICNELGMEPEELLRIKHITGFSKLFSDIQYNKSWERMSQVEIRLEYERLHSIEDRD